MYDIFIKQKVRVWLSEHLRYTVELRGVENMIPMRLTYGNEGFNEIRDFLKKHYYKNYTLSIFDTIAQATIEVTCDFDDMVDVIIHVSNVEHDFPAWIGVNELSDSYVVGIAFTRGRLSTPSIRKWENNKLL